MNTYDDLPKDLDMAIIAVGSVEQHGTHLPLGTDYFHVKHLSEAVAKELDAYLLPPLPFGTCNEHRGRRGYMGFKSSTLKILLDDMVLCLQEQGFTKVVIMSGHGGNFVLGPIVRDLNARNDNLQVILMQPQDGPKMQEICDGNVADEVHAGERETSLMMYHSGQYVKVDKCKENDCIPNAKREWLNMVRLIDISETGAWGKPSLATKEKGEALFAYQVEVTVNAIKELLEICKKEKWQRDE